uniref:Transmembrane protein n=1 Tax=Chromera velia CCMP2878 TaxID=1169474 RepID=A0A0G4IA32_9ALVE|eukprot:Cvel_12412.t1-p1 / transcript=Cvel_12412.t1 / gene=Cvel_12412 / organism=Chromera_velia_CCMP2878 / gene_product=hypothetical protein / transcript_product=hypothetical protein / location=Cvel_scaffold812:5625-8979(+) / protein_length=569 / sequence_SO=supercontig / SO=protein_coding / is_pseudo=false
MDSLSRQLSPFLEGVENRKGSLRLDEAAEMGPPSSASSFSSSSSSRTSEEDEEGPNRGDSFDDHIKGDRDRGGVAKGSSEPKAAPMLQRRAPAEVPRLCLEKLGKDLPEKNGPQSRIVPRLRLENLHRPADENENPTQTQKERDGLQTDAVTKTLAQPLTGAPTTDGGQDQRADQGAGRECRAEERETEKKEREKEIDLNSRSESHQQRETESFFQTQARTGVPLNACSKEPSYTVVGEGEGQKRERRTAFSFKLSSLWDRFSSFVWTVVFVPFSFLLRLVSCLPLPPSLSSRPTSLTQTKREEGPEGINRREKAASSRPSPPSVSVTPPTAAAAAGDGSLILQPGGAHSHMNSTNPPGTEQEGFSEGMQLNQPNAVEPSTCEGTPLVTGRWENEKEKGADEKTEQDNETDKQTTEKRRAVALTIATRRELKAILRSYDPQIHSSGTKKIRDKEEDSEKEKGKEGVTDNQKDNEELRKTETDLPSSLSVSQKSLLLQKESRGFVFGIQRHGSDCRFLFCLLVLPTVLLVVFLGIVGVWFCLTRSFAMRREAPSFSVEESEALDLYYFVG